MDLEKENNNSMIIKYQNTDNVLKDVCSIIESARDYAYQSVNIALIERNWFIGYRIAESKLNLKTFKRYGIYFSLEFEKMMIEHPEKLFDPNKTSSRKAFLDEMKKYQQNAKFFESQNQMEEIEIWDFTRFF